MFIAAVVSRERYFPMSARIYQQCHTQRALRTRHLVEGCGPRLGGQSHHPAEVWQKVEGGQCPCFVLCCSSLSKEFLRVDFNVIFFSLILYCALVLNNIKWPTYYINTKNYVYYQIRVYKRKSRLCNNKKKYIYKKKQNESQYFRVFYT